MSGRPFLREDKGAVAVEFALVVPAFLVMLLGIVWAGWIVYNANSVHHALAMGARVLQLKPTTTQSELQTYVRNQADLGENTKQIIVTLTFDPVSGGTQLAQTTATFPLTFTIPLMGTYSISYTTSMTVPVIAG